MNESCEEFLAGAALAEDQYVHRPWRDSLRHRDDVACGLTGTDDELAFVALGNFLAQPDDIAPKILTLAGIDEQCAQRLEVDVLGRVVVRAQPHRFHGDVELLDLGDGRSPRRTGSSP
jgi:hypothetical protein